MRVSTFLAMARRTRIQGWFRAAAALALVLAAPATADAAFRGDNGRIYFDALAPGSGTPDVWSINPDGSGLTDLTVGRDPSAAPNGPVAFTVGSGAASEIWAMNPDGSGAHRLTNDGFADQMPAFSPDASRIAWTTDRGGATGFDLWTMAADGSDPQPLLTAPGDDLWPQYSSNGQYVVLATNVSGNFDIAYVMTAGAPHKTATSTTTRSTLDQTEPSIMPDMARLAYTQSDDIQTAYSLDGTDEYPLAVDPARDEHSASFAPDASMVVYVADAGLMVASAGGFNAAPLPTGQASSPSNPDWAVGPPADGTPPQTTISMGPRAESKHTTARFRFKSSEPGSTFSCRLDRGTFEPCTSPQRFRDLKPGRHRFAVDATDAAGNADPSPAAARFRVLRSR
jgi:hypothetical protein